VAAREPRGRNDRLASGQHFLRSSRVAAELVAAAAIGEGDLVVEIGSGFGRLTTPLAMTAGRVWAVEIDPVLAAGLRRRFAGHADVDVVEADMLTVPFPGTPFRAFGNLPFAHTSAMLRRLLDAPDGSLQRADLIVEDGAARKCCAVRPCAMRSLGWLPWWRFRIERHIPARAFDPPPSVDAALLCVTRRDPALLAPAAAGAYRDMLAHAFRRAQTPLRRTLRMPPRAWKRLARERGLPIDARPPELDVWDWLAVFGQVS
jgi:23S rRNA (adenine-N6)-dimethyltransferase